MSEFLDILASTRAELDGIRGNSIQVYRGESESSAVQWRQGDNTNPYIYELRDPQELLAWDTPISESVEYWVVRFAGGIAEVDAPLNVTYWLSFDDGQTLSRCRAAQRRPTSLGNGYGFEILLERTAS